MSIPRLLAEKGLASVDGGDGGMSIGERRAMVRGIDMGTRQLRAVGRNLNQLAAAANSGSVVEREQVLATLGAVRRAAERLEATVGSLAPRSGWDER